MKKELFFIYSFLIIAVSLSGQKNELITVEAGTLIKSYFPPAVRYRYKYFTEGTGILKSGDIIHDKFNYNLLMGEMEFIRSKDTLAVTIKGDLRLFTIAADTFYYDNGYLEQIRSGKVKVFQKQKFKLKDILKKGAMGTTARNTSVDSYNSVSAMGNFYELRPEEDWVFQKTIEYYFLTPESKFVLFGRKNAIQAIPGKEEIIKNYLKSNKVDFNSREDILRFADFMSGLSPDV
jgi:hypothetical protein